MTPATTTATWRPHAARYASALAVAAPQPVGTVTSVLGLGLEVAGLDCALGDLVIIGEAPGLEAEVVAAVKGSVRCMPLGRLAGISAGAPARAKGSPVLVPTGRGLFGRVLDGIGRPIDGKGPLLSGPKVAIDNDAPEAMRRARISLPLQTGVRVLDTMTTMGKGQRMGLFAGSGVGKSSLLSMVARGTDAEVSVIALVGERGREVREFLEDDLGPEGLSRSVVVVATSDEPALMRMRAAFTATRIAESFRENGQDVVLMMDSLTRVAMAQREIGLSAGEPPATRGYPPSTFSVLARLLERAGTAEAGSVTGIYTVLVDGDDHNEPIADAVRGILDGHIVMERSIAERGRYPAINVLKSVSRTMPRACDPAYWPAVQKARQVLGTFSDMEELIRLGAYRAGSSAEVDEAISLMPQLDAFLAQGKEESTSISHGYARLADILGQT